MQKNISIILSTLFLSLISILGFSQATTIISPKKSIQAENQKIKKTYRSYKNPLPQTKEAFLSQHHTKMGLSVDDELVLYKTSEGKNGYTHYRYHQYYNGIPVNNKTYILHTKDNLVLTSNGSLSPNINLSTIPTLDPNAALSYAQEALLKFKNDESIGEESQAHSHTHTHDHNHRTHYHKHDEHNYNRKDLQAATPKSRENSSVQTPSEPLLTVIDLDGIYHLAYKIELNNTDPTLARGYYIDANHGKVLEEEPLIQHYAVPGSGQSRYYGKQEFNVDSIAADEYILYDSTRGDEGILVTDDEDEVFNSSTRDFSYEDNAMGQTAIDAYYCTISFYDMLKEEFDWLGLDNENLSFHIGVNARDRTDYVNAFWNGEMAFIGNGDCNRGPLSTLEVIGHEFMHGVVDYTSNLVYRRESGAINESMADVMGKMLEHYYDPQNFKWGVGHSFILNEYNEVFRNMAEPLLSGNPAYYTGENWRYGGGVHTNSAIGNLWFYYLSEGGLGVTEGGESFSVQPLGIEEAGKFIFHVNRHYLTEDSQYIDYYEASLIALEEYFSIPDAVVDDIQEAWKAVGLPGQQGDSDYYDLRVFATDTEDACGTGTYVPIEFGIVNDGKVDYSSLSSEVEVSVSNGSNSELEYIRIDEIIPAGDTLLFQLDSLVLTFDDDFIFVRYEILDDDDYDSNNSDSDFISVSLFEEGDLELDIDIIEQSCFTKDKLLNVEVSNNSCSTVSRDTPFELVFMDTETGGILWTEDMTFEDDLRPNRSMDLELTLALDIQTQTLVDVFLNYNDPNTDNNMQSLIFRGVSTINEGYLNEFSNDEDLSQDLSVEVSAFDDPLISWQGENYFMTTGQFESPFSPLCLESNRDFEESVGSFFGGVTASIIGCADIDNDEVGLAFDYVQFRNQNSEFSTENSSALKVSWGEGDEADYKIFKEQEEGILESYLIPLPAYYKGPIEFRFVNHTGTSVFSNDFFDYDVSLLDNVRFDLRVGTEEIESMTQAKLYPNPAADQLYIVGTTPIHEALFYTAGGQRVKQLSGMGLQVVDVSDMESGFYFVELRDASGAVHNEVFVKM